MWLFAESLGVAGRLRPWILLGTMASGFCLVNTLFVWPKLLAATFLVALAALWGSRELLARAGRSTGIALLAGSLLGAGMLSHGGSAFAFAGLLLAAVFSRRYVSPKALATVVATFLVWYLPWVLYGKFFDPPADRLLKTHLAGVGNVDPRPFGQVLYHAYAQSTWGDLLAARSSNLKSIWGDQRAYWQTIGEFVRNLRYLFRGDPSAAEAASRSIASQEFFQFLPCLGLFMFGPLFYCARWLTLRWRGRPPDRTLAAAGYAWALVLLTVLVWCCLLFSPNAALVHQGSYFPVLLAFFASILSFWAVSPVWAKAAVILQTSLSLLVYIVWSKGVPLPGELAEGVFEPGALALLLIAAAAIGRLLRQIGRGLTLNSFGQEESNRKQVYRGRTLY